jgi:hypothetical protein
MSLNNLSLTPQLIADLFSDSLIENLRPSSIEQTIKFLGKNEKNILILVSEEEVAFLEDNELNFLSTVLGACKLSLADIAIVNLYHLGSINYRHFIKQLNAKKVMLFDVEAQTIDLPFNFPHFQIQQFDQCTYLSAPALKNIETDKALKTQLWNCLKKLFGL